MGELLGGRDYDGLDVRSQPAVRVRNRAFCLEIDHVAHSPYDMVDAEFTTLVNSKVVVLDYTHAFQSFRGLTDDVNTLLIRKEASLVYIDSHSNDHFVEHGQRPLQDIEVTSRKRVKGSRKHSYPFHNHQLMF